MSAARSHNAYVTMEDEELIRRAQRVDMPAFEQLVFQHEKSVLSIAARYVTSADDAKDIYREAFLRACRGLRKFRSRSEFSTWLHRKDDGRSDNVGKFGRQRFFRGGGTSHRRM